MATFRSTINAAAVTGKVDAAGTHGLTVGLEFLLTEANKTVPHDEGTLERSGATEVDGLRGAVSYDTPYAARQHEDLTLRHDGKGTAKWLENAMTGNRATLAQIIAQAMRTKIGG